MKDLPTLIPFLNLYPAWAQVIVVACVVVVIVVLCFVPRKETHVEKSKFYIEKGFEVNVSLTDFTKTAMNWSPADSLCIATFNLMNAGDVPFTAHDFFITVSLDKDGTKSVHRALDETGEKLQSVVVDPGKSFVVKAYFDIRKAIFAVPDKEGEKLTLYCNIVVEAIARDGLRENLVFRGNTLITTVMKAGQDHVHKVLHAGAAYRTSAIKFLGHHAKK
jgi:hypothetical protein